MLTIFKNMFAMCQKTCLQCIHGYVYMMFGDISQLCLNTCLHPIWGHFYIIFEDMFTPYLKALFTQSWMKRTKHYYRPLLSFGFFNQTKFLTKFLFSHKIFWTKFFRCVSTSISHKFPPSPIPHT